MPSVTVTTTAAPTPAATGTPAAAPTVAADRVAGPARGSKPGRPVFVDPTGRRQTRSRAVVLGTVVAVLTFLAATATGVATGAGAPVHWEPGSRADVSVVSR